MGKLMMTILRIKGSLDVETIPRWREIMIDELANSEGDAVMDFSRVSFVDTAGMAFLLSLHECLAAMDRRLIYRNLCGQPEKTFRILNFHKSTTALRGRPLAGPNRAVSEQLGTNTPIRNDQDAHAAS